ncbi:MAG: DUF1015 domain-containing protein [Thermoguttaceae bacterium]|nr:DUF1015 domain-containing protein [Thermoguttaceae bacterium]
MPNIQPINGIRYNLGQVGALSDVIAPPYDVISPELQDELYAKHPNNCVRLILNKTKPTDDETDNRYTRARKTMKKWLDEGVLFTEADPAIYVYYQIFEYAGKTYTRKGFMAGLEVQPFGQGCVFPHELTHAAAKADRLMLTTTTKAQLSQIFGLYPDAENAVLSILEKTIEGKTPLEAVDHLGVIHRMWVVTNPQVIAEVQAAIGKKPVFIADGHHRYETACNYLAQLKQQGIPATHPAHYVLTMFVAMEDDGLAVLPTHRLFPGIPEMTSDELAAKLGACFTCTKAGTGPETATDVWEEIESLGSQENIAFYTTKDDTWTIASLTEAGREKMAEDGVAADHSEDWRNLGVSILHKLVMDTLLEQPNAPKPTYVHLVSEVVDDLKAEPGKYPLAALVMPATVENIKTLCLEGERMPQKSTYFYPKLLSGLVFRSVEG